MKESKDKGDSDLPTPPAKPGRRQTSQLALEDPRLAVRPDPSFHKGEPYERGTALVSAFFLSGFYTTFLPKFLSAPTSYTSRQTALCPNRTTGRVEISYSRCCADTSNVRVRGDATVCTQDNGCLPECQEWTDDSGNQMGPCLIPRTWIQPRKKGKRIPNILVSFLPTNLTEWIFEIEINLNYKKRLYFCVS